MKCPYCSQWSDVLETRDGPSGMRRRRKCANGHRFSTHEQASTVLLDRDRQMVAAVLAGAKLTDVAKAFGLRNHSQVSRIVKRMAPMYPARSAGQLARHAEQRAKA